jgi:hypothetical protein
MTLAMDLVSTMRAGTTATDAGRVLFDSQAHPTWQQVKGFVLAVIEHLAPDLADQPDGAILAPPVTLGENVSRGFRHALGLNR